MICDTYFSGTYKTLNVTLFCDTDPGFVIDLAEKNTRSPAVRHTDTITVVPPVPLTAYPTAIGLYPDKETSQLVSMYGLDVEPQLKLFTYCTSLKSKFATVPVAICVRRLADRLLHIDPT